MPRKPRYLSQNTNNQPPHNETSNNLHNPWFPFDYDSQTGQQHTSSANIDSAQPSVSAPACHGSSLQSKNSRCKRKVDTTIHDPVHNYETDARNVRPHVQVPISHPVVPSNDSISLQVPTTSESSMSVDNYFQKSTNVQHKRKTPPLENTYAGKNEIAPRYIRRCFEDSLCANSLAQTQFSHQHTSASTNDLQNTIPSTQRNSTNRMTDCQPNMQAVMHHIASQTSNPSIHNSQTFDTETRPPVLDTSINTPASVSDASTHEHLHRNSHPKRSHRIGGNTYDRRRRLRADNLSNSSISSSVPDVASTSVLPHSDSTPSYEDLGDCDQRCRHCGAAFWYEERVKRSSTVAQPDYHLCCGDGKIIMNHEPNPPEYIRQLLSDPNFMENIRAYNQMFAMTSFGATIDKSINTGQGPYVFKVSGQIYHWIGSLCPLNDNDTPRFLQLYIYDTENEVKNRLSHFEPSERSALNPDIVQGLIEFFDTHNELVKVLRTARDLCNQTHIPDFKLRLYNAEGVRTYELPTSNAIAAIVFDSGPTTEADYDVIIQYKGDQPQRINKLHQSYMSLQFPLIFIYGQPGFHTELKLRSTDPTQKPRRVTMNAFYMYQLHPRHDSYNLLFRTGRLFQQYVVAVYCCIEQNNMDFYRKHQSDIRGDYLCGLYDAVARGDCDGFQAGSRIILPSSFTGGPRYMYSHYLDALAICRKLGNPQFFITFTCNTNWPEIQRYMAQFPHLTTSDRADVVCRVFEQKIKAFLDFLKNKRPFGHITGVLYTVEFQKRGLPHCHTLVWISSSDKIQDAQDVDQYISAELPDPAIDPHGYKIVSDMMMHGPCGAANLNAPCMEGTSCTKNFPKRYNQQTFFDTYGQVHYRRRQTEISTIKKHMKLDNTYVVPYNRTLCLTFQAHINVEYCGWSMLIKYLFKYISKGTDRIFAKVTRSIGDASTSSTNQQSQIDEIQNFQDGRFICPHEAMWRILNFRIHAREPAVQILAVHLENMQHITFRDNNNLESIINRRDRKVTTLTEWFDYNAHNEDGRHLTYLEFPSEFVWYRDKKIWQRRKMPQSSVGRLSYIHPSLGELFYFRMLLCHQKGCKGFTDVKKVNRVFYPTYRAACEALGLLGDDREWDTALEEACLSASSSELRSVFAHILTYCEVVNPIQLWNKYWKEMGHDIPKIVSRTVGIRNYYVNESELKGYILFELQVLFNTLGKSLKDFDLPPPPKELLDELENRLLMEEKNYNREELKQENEDSVPKLNSDQRQIYDLIMNAFIANKQELIFVYGHGGTGKTFLWKTIISGLRSQGNIVLAVASSGIASLLLPAGRTAHSRFKLPLELTEETLCKVKKNTHLGRLLLETGLIIWDEAPMNDRRCFEALDRTLRDLLDTPEILFGGKSIILGGDFRQTLPVKKGAPTLGVPTCKQQENMAPNVTKNIVYKDFLAKIKNAAYLLLPDA